jgi:hypothetical protein
MYLWLKVSAAITSLDVIGIRIYFVISILVVVFCYPVVVICQ